MISKTHIILQFLVIPILTIFCFSTNGRTNHLDIVKSQNLTLFNTKDDTLKLSSDSVTHQRDKIVIKKKLNIVELPQIEATFPGGNSSLKSFISRACIYPQEAFENGIDGKVYAEMEI